MNIIIVEIEGIRLANYGKDITHNGNVYKKCGFSLQMPKQTGKEKITTSFSIDNIDRDLNSIVPLLIGKKFILTEIDTEYPDVALRSITLYCEQANIDNKTIFGNLSINAVYNEFSMKIGFDVDSTPLIF